MSLRDWNKLHNIPREIIAIENNSNNEFEQSFKK